MLYLSRDGHMWDTSIVYHDNRYYLFSMFNYYGENCVNVWCAASDDGVHYRDVGTVISDQAHPVWKMFVHRYGDQYVMNYGSFSGREGHGNDKLQFWTSRDLINWTYCGEEKAAYPDPRWYCEEQRFDHMYTMDHDDKYYGYVVATPKEGGGVTSLCGMMESTNGLEWTPLPPPAVEWGDISPFCIEVGGCEKIGDRYYLIGGVLNAFGSNGYSVFTFVADSPLGPFRPNLPRFRLCGNSSTRYGFGRQWLASFAKGKDGEVLITNYLTASSSEYRNFIGTKENVWFLPIKKAIIGKDQELVMAYWKPNDLLKGKEVLLDRGHPTKPNDAVFVEDGVLHVNARDCRTDAFLDEKKRGDEYNWAFLTPEFDIHHGIVVEGTLTVSSNGKMSRSAWGVLLGETAGATLISIETGDRRTTRAQISFVNMDLIEQQDVVDIVIFPYAGKTDMELDKETSFRLLARQNIFEIYIDDLLVQTYTLKGESNGKIGFYVRNAFMAMSRLQVFEMNLNR